MNALIFLTVVTLAQDAPARIVPTTPSSHQIRRDHLAAQMAVIEKVAKNPSSIPLYKELKQRLAEPSRLDARLVFNPYANRQDWIVRLKQRRADVVEQLRTGKTPDGEKPNSALQLANELKAIDSIIETAVVDFPDDGLTKLQRQITELELGIAVAKAKNDKQTVNKLTSKLKLLEDEFRKAVKALAEATRNSLEIQFARAELTRSEEVVAALETRMAGMLQTLELIEKEKQQREKEAEKIRAQIRRLAAPESR